MDSGLKDAMDTYKMCSKTVLDTTVPGITFNNKGECNFCEYYYNLASRTVLRDAAIKQKELESIVSEIKKAGKGKQYDCVLGVSGGQDSTYLAHLAKQLGLRPLLVHFDNGWNAELAVNNIEKVVNKLGLNLYTHVMDWDEFRDLQRAYFLASVVDVEVPTDQLIFAALHRIAYKENIKFILAGNNVVTESINPDGWVYKRKLDLVNLKAIHRKFGLRKLKKLPRLGMYERYFYEAICGIQTVNLLDLIDYNKEEIKKLVQNEFGWRDYGGKHYESVFTRFYQGYYLPVKFNIDKRKAHLSNLILSGQLSREDALKQLATPTYDSWLQEQDKVYIQKKLGFSPKEWSDIMEAKPVAHSSFETEESPRYRFFYSLFRYSLYLPVRFFRLLGLIHRPVKVTSGW